MRKSGTNKNHIVAERRERNREKRKLITRESIYGLCLRVGDLEKEESGGWPNKKCNGINLRIAACFPLNVLLDSSLRESKPGWRVKNFAFKDNGYVMAYANIVFDNIYDWYRLARTPCKRGTEYLCRSKFK